MLFLNTRNILNEILMTIKKRFFSANSTDKCQFGKAIEKPPELDSVGQFKATTPPNTFPATALGVDIDDQLSGMGD